MTLLLRCGLGESIRCCFEGSRRFARLMVVRDLLLKSLGRKISIVVSGETEAALKRAAKQGNG
jgi:hypothetical protein